MPIPSQRPSGSSRVPRKPLQRSQNASKLSQDESNRVVDGISSIPPTENSSKTRSSSGSSAKRTKTSKHNTTPKQLKYEFMPELGPDMVRDKRTGKIYELIPKSELDEDGRPKLQIDIDDMDLNSSANRFLAHLRVPPDRAEREQLRELRRMRAKKQDEDYARLQEAIHDMEDASDED